MATSNTARVSSMDGARFSRLVERVGRRERVMHGVPVPEFVGGVEPRHSQEGGVCGRAAHLFRRRAISYRVLESFYGGYGIVFQDDADKRVLAVPFAS